MVHVRCKAKLVLWIDQPPALLKCSASTTKTFRNSAESASTRDSCTTSERRPVRRAGDSPRLLDRRRDAVFHAIRTTYAAQRSHRIIVAARCKRLNEAGTLELAPSAMRPPGHSMSSSSRIRLQSSRRDRGAALKHACRRATGVGGCAAGIART